MRILGLLVLGAALCGNAMALEASAGADTVNSSQVGLDAKLNATNAITTATINQIMNCQKAGKLFDPSTSTCIAVDEPLAKKIAACTTTKQFYNQTTSGCMASAPDLTNNLNSTNELVNKMASCNAAKQFYNPSTGGCMSSGSGTPVVNYSACSMINDQGKGKEVMCPGNRVLVSIVGGPVETGRKLWHGSFRCCALRMQ